MAKVRRSGDTNLVEFHLVFDEGIGLREAHQAADEIESRVRALADTRWIINIHLDPVDSPSRTRRSRAAAGRNDR